RSGTDGLHIEQLRCRRRGRPAEDYLIRAHVPAGTPRTALAVDVRVDDASQREAPIPRAAVRAQQMVVAARSTHIGWGALLCAAVVVGCRTATQGCSPRCESRVGAAVPDPVRGAVDVVDVPIGNEPAWSVCDVDDGRVCLATPKDVSQDLDVVLSLTKTGTVRAEADQSEIALGSVGLE